MHSTLLERLSREFCIGETNFQCMLTIDYSCGPTDVTSKADLEKLVEEISKKEKHIDLLCTTFLNRVSHTQLTLSSDRQWYLWTKSRARFRRCD